MLITPDSIESFESVLYAMAKLSFRNFTARKFHFLKILKVSNGIC